MKYSKSTHLKIRAFTLLECLVALLVISGSVLVLQGLTKIVRNELVYLQQTKERDWQRFCNQMRYELDGSEFIKVEGNFLYVKKTSDWRFGLPATGDDFRKSNADGRGYQPMLYGVKAAVISENKGLVKITLTLEQGGKREFYYRFSTN